MVSQCTDLVSRWNGGFDERRDEGVGSAGQALVAGADEVTGGPSIVEPPAIGHRQSHRVTVAEVVVVWIALGCELVEPHQRSTVLVAERGLGESRAAGP
jgi:hypothetical protein